MVSKGPAEGYQRKVTSVRRCCEPRFCTFLPLLAEYNYAKFQNCTIKTIWVIASQRKCWRTDGLTDKQGAVPLWTQNLYTFVSYCRVQLCKVSKLYDKNFWVIASQLRLSHHDENVDGQTNGRADETQNLYTSASYCRIIRMSFITMVLIG